MDRFIYAEPDETPVATCKYSGEPIYPWDTVAIFKDGSVVLLEYEYEYMRQMLRPKISEGVDLYGEV